MRIAEVVPHRVHPYSGVFAVIVRLSIALARRGHAVEVWQLHEWPERDTLQYVEALEAAGVGRVLVHDGGPWLRPSAKGVIAEREVQLVHLHNVFSLPNNLLARRLLVPYLVTPHGGYAPPVLRRHPLRKAVFAHLWERPLLRRSRALCALTPTEADDIRRFGYSGSLFVIPNGVDPPPSSLDRGAFRRSLGLGPDDRLAVFVGRLDVHYKRLDLLVRGLAEAPDWRLALVGPEWEHSGSELAGLIERHQLANRVWLVGPMRGRPLVEAMGGADLFVLPSRQEGLPLALLEALACGVPALVSPAVERAVGVGELGAGWVSEPEKLGATLRALAGASAEEWAQKRRAAVDLARAYSWDEVAARYEEVAGGVLASAAPSARS